MASPAVEQWTPPARVSDALCSAQERLWIIYRVAESSFSPVAGRDGPQVWVIIPAYNEEERLAGTLSGVCSLGYQVVVVDDGSQDNTAAVALRYPVWLLRHRINCGQGAALQTGIDFALRQGADILVTFDADGQHAPADIPRLLAPLLAGQADVALGSRFLGRTVGLPWQRRLVLRLGVLFTRLVSGLRLTDTHNGLRAFCRQAAARLQLSQDRMAHASEILDRIGQERWRYVEVPVTISYTPATLAKGQSSWNALRIAGEFLLGRMIP
jgi:glycosyltransferase involved in cell wall biosynthesis